MFKTDVYGDTKLDLLIRTKNDTETHNQQAVSDMNSTYGFMLVIRYVVRCFRGSSFDNNLKQNETVCVWDMILCTNSKYFLGGKDHCRTISYIFGFDVWYAQKYFLARRYFVAQKYFVAQEHFFLRIWHKLPILHKVQYWAQKLCT